MIAELLVFTELLDSTTVVCPQLLIVGTFVFFVLFNVVRCPCNVFDMIVSPWSVHFYLLTYLLTLKPDCPAVYTVDVEDSVMVLCKIFDVFYFASSIEAKVCSVKGDRSTEQRFCDGQYIGGTFWFFFTFASVIVLGHHCICKHTSCAAGGLQPAELIMWVIDICLSAWMCVVKRFSICYCATHMHSAYMPWQDVRPSVCLSVCHMPVLCLNG